MHWWTFCTSIVTNTAKVWKFLVETHQVEVLRNVFVWEAR